MKYWVLLFFLFTSLQLSAQSISDKKISINANSKSLKRVLNKIESDYDIAFAYKLSLVEGQTVSIKIKEVPLREALTLLFKNSEIGFAIKKNKVLLFKRNIQKDKFTISGFITDSISGEPLIGATIFSLKEKVGARTDENGYFSLTIPAGQYDFIISYIGFERVTLSRNMIADNKVSIALDRNSKLKRVIITEKKDEFQLDDQILLQSNALEALPSIAGEADVIRTLQLMPGIKSGTESASGLFVRGGGTRRKPGTIGWNSNL